MRQHRTIALLAALAALLVIPATGTSAPADPVRGPACGDITLGGIDDTTPPLYTTGNPKDSTPPTVYANLTIAGGAASCANVVYTIYVYDASGTTLLTSQPYFGDGSSDFGVFTYLPSPAPSSLCVYAESTINNHVIDRAPNEGCSSILEPIVLDGGSPGGQGYF